MSKVKKINSFFCLIFSFIFLFASVFSVSAAVTKENRVLEQCIDRKDYPNEIVKCVANYKTQNIRNNGERKIIWSIDKVEFRMAEKPFYQSQNDYKFDLSNVEISDDKKSAKIFVTVYRDGFGFWNGIEKFNLTFELTAN